MGTDLGATLHDHHRKLDAQLERLVDVARSDDVIGLLQVWDEFERGLLLHFDLEEQKLLPQLAHLDAPTAARLTEEHGHIRSLVARMGLGIELHIVREREVSALAEMLRDHAALEDATLYRVAEQLLPDDARLAISLELHKLWDESRRIARRGLASLSNPRAIGRGAGRV